MVSLHSKLIRTFCFNNPATFTGALFVPVFFIMFPANSFSLDSSG